MTNSEVLTLVKSRCDNCEDSHLCDICDVPVIIKALEKQIPQKPIKETSQTGFRDKYVCVSVNCKEINYRCPVCGDPLGTNYDDDYYNKWLKVCSNCSQRIDWSDGNGTNQH